MEDSIFQIAHRCKEISSEVQINVLVGNGHLSYQYEGSLQQFEKGLLKLCKALQNKYPEVSISLRNHISQYNNHPTFHQGAIEAILDCVINLYGCRESYRKVFISHASADAPIINAFIKEILMLGCGLIPDDIFCTLDHTAIRTGDDFREQIVENMKRCDFILCFISENYQKSEICQNEMGAAWTMDYKRILPFKFPNLSFGEIGFLNVVKQAANITDKTKLDELYREITEYYDMPQNWINYNQRTTDFINQVNEKYY